MPVGTGKYTILTRKRRLTSLSESRLISSEHFASFPKRTPLPEVSSLVGSFRYIIYSWGCLFYNSGKYLVSFESGYRIFEEIAEVV